MYTPDEGHAHEALTTCLAVKVNEACKSLVKLFEHSHCTYVHSSRFRIQEDTHADVCVDLCNFVVSLQVMLSPSVSNLMSTYSCLHQLNENSLLYQ